MAVFRSPAAYAFKIAGSRGIHKNCPRHIAAVLFNAFHSFGIAVDCHIHHWRNHFFKGVLISVAHKGFGKFHPVVFRIVKHLVQAGISGSVYLFNIRRFQQ